MAGLLRGKLDKHYVRNRLAQMGCDPIEGLALIAAGDGRTAEERKPISRGGIRIDHPNARVPVSIRARCYAELASYAFPKLNRTEVETDGQDEQELERRLQLTEGIVKLIDIAVGTDASSYTRKAPVVRRGKAKPEDPAGD